MGSRSQKEKATYFRQLHRGPEMLVLPNIWDAASARIIEQAGFPAIATTSSGLAAALGYSDGQHLSRELLIEALARITRVVEGPVTADIEAGFGNSIAEVVQTVKEVISAGVVGINIEDSPKQGQKALLDIAYQVELIQALRELATTLDVPFVINARTDVLLLGIGEPEGRFAHTVQRANAYLQAGADCVYPIGYFDQELIANLVKAINGPVNIMGSSSGPTLPELERLGVARVSLAGGVMRSILGHLRAIAQELREHGTYTKMSSAELAGAEFRTLFSD
ncbi:isocitrate lyase/phosphoenolpyruvate mutase family protein [Ktedonosporobacter rubrisoli]|uniref:Isocitrate lyase/phosphoenolpyruvate mutase family protein n=1 Tax=Ktedonosporobacter rubrisoli TaxID=2509675 RepID=A0A4P6JKX2_KTERU|nr:isocitrate lyase/phosphoenolpyruvate mutase family protein [Ktedonosporobacter rubrisoli]QBD75829.1 isocitrate lyase/phosphoenolpyruvate mutase family protein [Ktedonosporobacter rubrisoli]